jgi:Family of unknown function (DUF5719)
VSDSQLPPGPTGPDDERPPALIPSRAARHQKKGLFRGRSAKPPPPPLPPRERPAPPERERPAPPRDQGQAPPDWARPAPPDRAGQAPPSREGRPAFGRERPERPAGDGRQAPRRERPAPFGREQPAPPGGPAGTPGARSGPGGRLGAGLRRPGARVRPVPDLPGGEPAEEPRRSPALKTPQLRAPQLQDLRGSSLGLAGALVAVVAVLVMAANALPAAKPPATPASRDPYSARWVCPLLPGQSTQVTIANVGDATASLRSLVRQSGQRSAPTSKQLAGGETETLALKPAKAGFVQVEAFSAPVVVSAPGLGCAAGPGNRWWLPASDTRFGTDTRVVIANPDSQPAVVDLVPHLTSGSIRSDDREVFIQPGQTVVRELGDDAPAGLKPSIEVIARAGRVVAGAAVSSGGRSPTLLPAQGAARPAWSFAGGVSGGGRQAQVLVTNPNPTPLQVDVRVTTAKATFRPPGEFGEPIANGGTAELAIPTLDVKGPFAVQVRSVDGSAFVAALRVSEGDGNQTTSRIDLGTGQSERGWLVPGPPEGGQLVLANLSSGELEARLRGLAGGGAAGQPIRVPPGRVTVKKVPNGIDNLVVQSPSAGLVAAPLGGGPIVPGSAIGGLPAGGPILPGPAAAP